MKFSFNKSKCLDMGLVVKHGNKDNIVFFFDEFEDAAIYRAILFRMDTSYDNEGFIQEKIINERKVFLRDNFNNITEKVFQSFDGHCSPSYNNNSFLSITSTTFNGTAYSFEDQRHWMGGALKLDSVKEEPFENIKYITQIEAQRNDMYINVDFLPCGNYLVILQAEGRNGEKLRETMPYYFKVEQTSQKELLDTIRGAGRAAYFGR